MSSADIFYKQFWKKSADNTEKSMEHYAGGKELNRMLMFVWSQRTRKWKENIKKASKYGQEMPHLQTNYGQDIKHKNESKKTIKPQL